MAKVTTKKINREMVASFLKIKEAYALMGLGITTGQVAMNANVTTEQYIHEKTAYNSVDSYAPSMDITQTAFKGDAVYDFIFDIYINRKTGADAETTMLNVYLAETLEEPASSYLAEEQKVAIEITNYGGDAGNPVTIEYTVHFNGDNSVGSATIAEGVPTFQKKATLNIQTASMLASK